MAPNDQVGNQREMLLIARNFDVLSYHPYPARFEIFRERLSWNHLL